MPEVSIIINCFNEEKFLPETMDSLFAQTFDDWEVIFWDNASTDSSPEIAKSYGEKVKYFRSETTLPLGQARKLAADQATGDYLAILDADDIWLPQKLERQLALHRANPELGLTYCDSTYFDETGDLYNLFQMNKPHRGSVFGQLLTKNFMFSSSMMFRVSAFQEMGYGFDDRLARAQDYELSLRLAYNFPVDYIDEPLCKWRMYRPSDKPWKKSLIPRVADVKTGIDHLIEMYPDIEERFPTELKSFNRRLDYNFGITAWEQGDSSLARSYLSRHMGTMRFSILYFSTFFLSHDSFYKLRMKLKKLANRKPVAIESHDE